MLSDEQEHRVLELKSLAESLLRVGEYDLYEQRMAELVEMRRFFEESNGKED